MNEVDSQINNTSDSKVMNDPVDQPSNSPAVSKKNPYTIWFVILAFVAPVTLAYIMYFFGDIKSFSNHGEILNPIIHISSFELKNEKNEIIAEKELTYKWRIISFIGKDCDQQCAAQLYDTRQIHTSLGKNRHRVLRMFVHLEPASETLTKLIDETHSNVIRVNGDAAVIINALGDNVGNNVSINNNETYIMDPMGNVMMRFTQEQPNKEFLYDLRKLLKASQIG
jgi:cytochrome oxidase Cu insertion factor (SCO1/SenC/PrrC family)